MANNASYTAYSIQDSLPRDLGAAKFAAMLQTETSAPGFALHRGIGPSQLAGSDYITAHLGVATHVQGSRIENGGVLNAVGGVYVENPNGASPVLSGRARAAFISVLGELHTAGVPLAASMVTTSRNTIKTSSGIVYSIHVAGTSVLPGDTIGLENQTARIATYAFGAGKPQAEATWETGKFNIPERGIRVGVGGLTGASIVITRTLAQGNASVTVVYA